jgi:predicted Zn finger-like uncharacterized protein
MTMLTRCAACATTFRLTTEQLASHQGKVRCGRCGAVFNALENLFEVDPATDAGADDRPPIDTATIDMFDPATPPSPAGPDAEATGQTPSEAPADVPPWEASPPSAPAEEHHPGEAAAASIEGTAQPDEHFTPTYRAEVAGTPLLVGTTPERRGTGWWSVLGALIAAFALAAQAAHHYRDQIAARVPATKPWLEQACAQIGCRILPPVDGQSISIESSDLQVDNGNRAVLILSAVLRNRADFAQPMPMLELSLTDALDAPVARRVLAPADYARTQPGIAAGGEVQVRVFIDATPVKANGYRLYAFYP